MTPRRSSVKAFRVADALAAELRRRILRNGYDDDGTLPKQDELVEEFGVSYPSVREALRILEAEGLITVRRGNVGGAIIRRPDARSAAYAVGLALESDRVRLKDLGESLLIFEPMCAALCAQRGDRASTVVPQLRANIEATEALIEGEANFTKTAREFHDIIVASTDNSTVRLTVRSLVALWTSQEEAWAEALADRGEYFAVEERREVIRAHAAIAAKIESGNAQAAERTARRHLAETQRLLLERFNDEVVDAHSAKAAATFRRLI